MSYPGQPPMGIPGIPPMPYMVGGPPPMIGGVMPMPHVSFNNNKKKLTSPKNSLYMNI